MAAELDLHTLTQIQKSAQSQQNPGSVPGSWMWNSKQAQDEDDDSWEVKAFAEDTNNAMGTTWPPRSYTCNFCRREFRSAQALGGHMNVHRRDRARLHQTQPVSTNPAAPSSALIIPTQEFATNGGLCLLYQLPKPSTDFDPSGYTESPSTLLSVAPYPPNPIKFSGIPSAAFNDKGNNEDTVTNDIIEELDLELRLGHSRPLKS